jgi:ketosteroid isomerase-like protein
MTADVVDVGSARGHQSNPFPGLRPFEPHESTLFFGREDQCDDLLARLGRRRLVAVVGMSGSGKSSLVRAGLLPALDRGYLPSAGSSWHIAIFRPGSDPVVNLARGLAERRLPGGGAAAENPDEIRALLDASSLGLNAVARRLLQDTGDSLLVVADQFEELFRFGRIAKSDGAEERSAGCVDLLLNASLQEEIPVYVVLTMRSDYLGDCARFTGLPEALNDSQFLVPRMTRAQLRDAIENPIAVGGASITPRLVQRLLHEIEEIPARSNEAPTARRDQDELPVLQHALMRMWDVSRAARERGEPIDLPHYEQPPIETLRHALDRHAEEVYQQLPTDLHRDVARLVFQQLTDRDAENREVRRPTPLAELTAVAQRAASGTAASADTGVIGEVIAAFAAPGREFVVVNAQQDVDISHESFIRRWTRLHEWVERESRSRRIYTKLADVAADWERGHASLYRGPELADARRWWGQETPTEAWANRYGARFDSARRFLVKSVRGRRLRLGLLFGNITLLLVSALAIAGLMWRSAREAERNAAEYEEARNNADLIQRRAEETNRILEQALALEREGKGSQADALIKQAQDVQAQKAGSSLTPSELSELDRLRSQETIWRKTEADLRNALAASQAAAATPASSSPTSAPASEVTAADRAELERLRSAESNWERDGAQLRQQVAAANERSAKLQAMLDTRADSPPPPPTTSPPPPAADASDIEQVLRDFEAAYERRDAEAVVKLMPSAKSADLTRSFSQLKSYGMDILDARISVTGDTAVVTCTRRVSIEPRAGARPAPRQIPTVIRLKQTGGIWTIESVEEKR